MTRRMVHSSGADEHDFNDACVVSGCYEVSTTPPAKLTTAANFVPGQSYVGTLDGPDEVIGRPFLVWTTSSRLADGPDGGERELIDVQLAFFLNGNPTIRVVTFAPGDVAWQIGT